MEISLITGITGQDGSYLAELLLSKGHRVIGLVRRTSTNNKQRIEHLLDNPNLILEEGDILDSYSLKRIIDRYSPAYFYNLAAQSHVGTSFGLPQYTFESIAVGTLNILEAIREINPLIKFYQASSSEMFGNAPMPENGYNETSPMCPTSPYAVAKLAAHHLTETYKEGYGIFGCSARLFNHECLVYDMPMIIKRGDSIDIKSVQEIALEYGDFNFVDNKGGVVPKKDLYVWNADGWTKVKCISWFKNKDKILNTINTSDSIYTVTDDHVCILKNGETESKNLKIGDKLSIGTWPTGKVQYVKLSEAKLLGQEIVKGEDHNLSEKYNYYSKSRDSVGNLYKCVPIEILNSDTEVMEAFLSGAEIRDNFKTTSPILAHGILYLLNKISKKRFCLTIYESVTSPNKEIFYLIKSTDRCDSGKITNIISKCEYHKDWLFDLETESGTYCAGIGVAKVHNSPRRGVNFVTRKITNYIGRLINFGFENVGELHLGNLDAKRDWGFAPDYVEAMYLMLQQDKPDDYVIATGETHTVREFCERAFGEVDLDYNDYVVINPQFIRPSEVHRLLGDPSKAYNTLGWYPKTTFKELVKKMVISDVNLYKVNKNGDDL